MRTTGTRRSFVQSGCACGLALLGSPLCGEEQTPAPTGASSPPTDLTNKPNPEQVVSFLKQIDSSGDESLRDAVFVRWGRECFYSRKLDQWIGQYRDRPEALFAYVNEGRSRYWERLDYDKLEGTLMVTSRRYPHCVCVYAQCSQPPKALCTHCCRAFHAELWKTLFGRNVSVEVPESILLGGARCRTTVRIQTI